MKTFLTASLFIIISLVLAVLLTIFMPGRTGIYVGTGLITLTFFCLLFPKKKDKITVGPFSWTQNDFCRGWLITGQTGSGKTACAIKTIITSLFRDCPDWGGAVVDQKGQFHEVVREVADNFAAAGKLVVLRTGKNAKNKYNLLSYPGIPWRTYAGIIVDTAESIGVKFSDAFWKNSAEELIEVMLQLTAVGKTPTFADLYDIINDKENMQSLVDDLTLMADTLSGIEQEMALKKIKHFMKLSQGQKDGILGACKNMLNFFGNPDIRDVFCPIGNTVNFTDMDKGKIFVISMPQHYSRERNYLNTFLKLLFAGHARFRFDNPGKYNLLAFIADEAQLVVTSSEMSSDHDTVAITREARATYILATQSITSFAPKLDSGKLDALVLNLSNQIYFTVADSKSAKLASEVFGEHTVTEESKTNGKSGSSTSCREVEKPIYKPSELRNLKKYQCIIRHPDGRHKKIYLPPIGKKGEIPYFYYRDRFGILAPFMYLLWK
ncbi:MAG: type IV secretory system conjugative DNA transfer family protein [Victivallales bacterium]|nr:type IV secretory system conjugative DNA transfer family protein [Victivallales bacterium]